MHMATGQWRIQSLDQAAILEGLYEIHKEILKLLVFPVKKFL